jgi:membrane protein DedA with SNARE-associated domain
MIMLIVAGIVICSIIHAIGEDIIGTAVWALIIGVPVLAAIFIAGSAIVHNGGLGAMLIAAVIAFFIWMACGTVKYHREEKERIALAAAEARKEAMRMAAAEAEIKEVKVLPPVIYL